jgi:HK97 family phage major capsid protein
MNPRDLKYEAHQLLEDLRQLNDRILSERRSYSAREEETWQKKNSRLDEIQEILKREKEKFPHAFSGVAAGGEIIRTDSEKRSFKLEQSNVKLGELREYLAHKLEIPGFEKRTGMAMDQDIKGGFAVMPTKMAGEWIKEKDDYVFVRRFARKFQCANAHEFRAPELNTEAQAATWGNQELGTGSEDDTMAISARNFHPKPLNHKIRVSKKLVRASEMDVMNFIINHLQMKCAEAEEEAFLEGGGNDRPLGIFTQHNAGVSSSRWVNTGNTSDSIKPDNLYHVIETMKAPYRTGARWVFSRTAQGQLLRLKDGEGRFMYEPSLQAGQPDRLLGYPVDISEFCPNTFDASLAVGALVNWSCYWVVDALDISVQVLRELYAETNQDMIIVRQEVDGGCVDEQGVVVVQLGS